MGKRSNPNKERSVNGVPSRKQKRTYKAININEKHLAIEYQNLIMNHSHTCLTASRNRRKYRSQVLIMRKKAYSYRTVPKSNDTGEVKR